MAPAATDTECPFCGKQVVPQSLLARHVLHSHDGSTVAGGSSSLTHYDSTSYFKSPYLCWCGYFFDHESTLLAHWLKRGGLHAHILEIALGGPDGGE